MNNVYKYVPLNDIYDYSTTLEWSYYDYDNVNLVTIFKNGHIIYYLEVYVSQEEEYYDGEKLLEYI